MTEIPADIMEKAEAVQRASLGRGLRQSIELIAKAIAEERQRCANVAKAHRSKIDVNEPLWHDGADWACDRIEQAIIAGAKAGAP